MALMSGHKYLVSLGPSTLSVMKPGQSHGREPEDEPLTEPHTAQDLVLFAQSRGCRLE